MATKTWKIGERCVGGVITVDVDLPEVRVYIREWDFSKGSTKRSSQINAKILFEDYFDVDKDGWQWDVEKYLNEVTTCYHADKVLEWIRLKTDGTLS